MSVQRSKYDYTPIGPFAAIITKYLAYKRALGFNYGIEEGMLYRFLRLSYSYPLADREISLELLKEWCSQRKEEKASTHKTRVNTILQFCLFAQAYGFRVMIPEMPRIKTEKYQPYIFTSDEIRRIILEADRLEPYPGSLRHIQVPVLFRLLFSTGLRASEAGNIKCGDIDLDNGIIAIYEAKFGKDRLVLLSDSMSEVLKEYFLRYRKDALPSNYLFPAKFNEHLKRKGVYNWFRILLDKAEIPHLGKGLGPREHDIRHSFCVHSLQAIQQEGIDLYAGLPLLSVFIGHKSIKETQHYLRLTSEFYPEVIQQLHESGYDILPLEGGFNETY